MNPRRTKLIKTLQNTVAETVHLSSEWVKEALGAATANELAIYAVDVQQAPKKKRRPNSQIKPGKLVTSNPTAGFDRKKLLKALKDAEENQNNRSRVAGRTRSIDEGNSRGNSTSESSITDTASGSGEGGISSSSPSE